MRRLYDFARCFGWAWLIPSLFECQQRPVNFFVKKKVSDMTEACGGRVGFKVPVSRVCHFFILLVGDLDSFIFAVEHQ